MRVLSTLVFTVAGIISLTYGQTWQNEKNCGISFTDRIVGGKFASKGKYPWLARIGFGNPMQGKYTFVCGGALISKNFVLTASHCFNAGITNSNTIVHLGVTEITCTKAPCKDPNIQIIKVKKLITHDQFNTTNGYADIALIQLESPATLNQWVKPICLSGEIGPTIGEDGIAAGWGYEDSKTRESPNSLKELKMEIVPGSACGKYFRKANFKSKNYICVGGNTGEDTCGGDSGGPFMKIANLGDVPRMYLLGVLSFGSSQCGRGVPSTFTSVAYYLDWIIENATNFEE